MFIPGYHIHMLSTLGKCEMSEWISVEDGLPEDGEWVLFCEAHGSTDIAQFKQTTDGRHNKRSGYFIDNNHEYIIPDYWMPLPEPPK